MKPFIIRGNMHPFVISLKSWVTGRKKNRTKTWTWGKAQKMLFLILKAPRPRRERYWPGKNLREKA